MKKFTLLLSMLCATLFASAQITYTTVYSEGFETSNGIPSNFLCKKQTTWTTLNVTLNPNVYTGTLWKDLYSNGYTTNKTYQVAADLTAPRGGTQCLKFSIPNAIFVDQLPHDTVFTVRLRGLDNKISFNTSIGESLSKYEVSFWAKTDGNNKDVLVNTQTTSGRTYLTLTSEWKLFTIERYATGTSATALSIDFAPATDASDYVVYLDDLTVKERKIAYTSTASDITTTGFTANWTPVAGATSYNLVVEKSDGGSTPTWTAISGSPFVVGNVNTFAITGLDQAATYRYHVSATDGSITTIESNNTFATTKTETGIHSTKLKLINVKNGLVNLQPAAGQSVDIYSTTGQLLITLTGNGNVINYQLPNKGMYIVRSNSQSLKVVY